MNKEGLFKTLAACLVASILIGLAIGKIWESPAQCFKKSLELNLEYTYPKSVGYQGALQETANDSAKRAIETNVAGKSPSEALLWAKVYMKETTSSDENLTASLIRFNIRWAFEKCGIE